MAQKKLEDKPSFCKLSNPRNASPAYLNRGAEWKHRGFPPGGQESSPDEVTGRVALGPRFQFLTAKIRIIILGPLTELLWGILSYKPCWHYLKSSEVLWKCKTTLSELRAFSTVGTKTFLKVSILAIFHFIVRNTVVLLFLKWPSSCLHIPWMSGLRFSWWEKFKQQTYTPRVPIYLGKKNILLSTRDIEKNLVYMKTIMTF